MSVSGSREEETDEGRIGQDGERIVAVLSAGSVYDGDKARRAYRRDMIINVLRNMSVSCDCEGTAAEPVLLPDLGMLASTDLQAVDRASVDMIYALPEKVRAPLVERMESREGLRQLSYMKELGLGSSEYELVWI